MLEAHKDKIFVAPGLSVIIRLLHEGEVVGVTNAIARDMGYELELEAAVKSMKAMLKRGIRVLPGGDYGFAWAPHGENAKDSSTRQVPRHDADGGPHLGDALGRADHDAQGPRELREGWLADLLLVDGDPLANISILQDKSKLLAIMKGRRVREDAGNPLRPEPVRGMTRFWRWFLGAPDRGPDVALSAWGAAGQHRASSSSRFSTA